jgi:hypothetical protein
MNSANFSKKLGHGLRLLAGRPWPARVAFGYSPGRGVGMADITRLGHPSRPQKITTRKNTSRLGFA